MPFTGSDPEQLDRLAQQLTDRAEDLDSIRGQLGLALHHGPWVGPDAERMRGEWDSSCVRILLNSADALRQAAVGARENAAQQRQVSDTDGGSGAVTFSGVAAGVMGAGAVGAAAVAGASGDGETDENGNPLEPVEQILAGKDFDEGIFAAITKSTFEEATDGIPVLGEVAEKLPWVGLGVSSFSLGYDLADKNWDGATSDMIGVGLAAAMILCPEVMVPLAIGAGVVAGLDLVFGKDAVGHAVLSVGKSFIDDVTHPFENPLSTVESFAVNPVGAAVATGVGEATKLFKKIF